MHGTCLVGSRLIIHSMHDDAESYSLCESVESKLSLPPVVDDLRMEAIQQCQLGGGSFVLEV